MNTPKGDVMTALAFVALVVAVGTVVSIEVALLGQSVQSADAKGCQIFSPAFNASQGRCFHPA